MPKKFSLLAVLLIAAAAVSLAAARRNPFQVRLSPDLKIVHALKRLTFGPRPADVEQVRSLGLDKWIDQQLHPARPAESPVLAAKLAPLDSIRQSPIEMVQNYPPPQFLRARAAGRVPYPRDPEKRQAFGRTARRFRQNQPDQADTPPPAGPPSARPTLSRLLSQDRSRCFATALPRTSSISSRLLARPSRRR